MRLTDTYYGGDDPFEGDRKIWLRSLPASARVMKAAITLKPSGQQNNLFEYFINFPFGANRGDWGATKTVVTESCEVDFHARRTLVRVAGSGEESELQIDMGGSLVSIADDGTFWTNGKVKELVNLQLKAESLPSLTANKIRFYKKSGTLDISSITIRSIPSNLSLRLGDKPPFWMRLGELAASQTSPDFASVLNAFLADAAVKDGYHQIPFVVHSDTIARLDVQLDIDYVIEEPVLPSYLPEITLPYSYSSLPGASENLLTVKLPRGAKPVSGTGGRVQGIFDSSRVAFGEIGESEEKDKLKLVVSPECSLATPIQLDRETPVNGIDLPLANTDPGLAGLHLALQEDADGTPSGKILTKAEVKVAMPVPGDSAWVSAQLPAEFRFEKNKRYWLVVQSLNGQASWTVEPCDEAAVALQASTNGGFSWRTAATSAGLKPLQAVFRLRYNPERFTVPVQLEIKSYKQARRVKFSQFAALGRVEFGVDFAEDLGKFLASEKAASACGKGNLISNGSFDLPPHTDASRMIFGIDSGYINEVLGLVNLSCGVDLSIRRFISVSTNGRELDIIDCAGEKPSLTTLREIENIIDKVKPYKAEKYETDNIQNLVVCAEDPVILYPWCRNEMPQDWNCTPDVKEKIWRLKIPTIFNTLDATDILDADILKADIQKYNKYELLVIALMAGNAGPAEIYKKILIKEGCSYCFSFRFLQPSQIKDEDKYYNNLKQTLLKFFPTELGIIASTPVWMINWLDKFGQIIKISKGEPNVDRMQFPKINGFLKEEQHLVSPSGSVQAEIHFIQPPPGLLLLDDVSFAPTYEALINGSFQQWKCESDQPETNANEIYSTTDWNRLSGMLEHYYTAEKNICLKLMGSGPEDAVLSQNVEVKSGEHLILSVIARPDAPSADDMEAEPVEQRARLELHWLVDGAAQGLAVVLPLDGRDFHTHSWAGDVPAGMSGAEIRLIQPRGPGNLLVGLVSLRHADLVPVELTFLSEAPGELTVSDLIVAYELPEPMPSPAPSLAPFNAVPVAGGDVLYKICPQTAPKPPLSEQVSHTQLANLDISSINGISEHTANIFKSLPEPIATVSDLSAMDAEIDLENVSRDLRLTLKASAEIIRSIALESSDYAALMDQSLASLWDLTSEQLRNRFGMQQRQIDQLQKNLRVLKLMFKTDAFRKLKLSQLVDDGSSQTE